jgi:predicted anti-sigma-YlaC factor YlaD
MKITCNIIKDLLSLYVEDMLSDDSVVMVEDHIKKCPACKSILAEMKEPYQVPVDMDTAPLLSIKSKLKKLV